MNDPFFIIAGERRSGSTTLYDVLGQHPEVGMLAISDFDFFIEPELFSRTPPSEKFPIKDWETTHPKEKYVSLFSDLSGVTGQKDADLFWWKPAHQRLARLLPKTRFIIVLRDPVKRAESQFFNETSKGRETRTFEEALKRDASENLLDWERLHLVYKSRGCYAESLQHFFGYIPRDRVKVIILEEWMDRWEMVMREICQFLKIDPEKAPTKPLHSNKEHLLMRRSFASKGMLKPCFDYWERISEGIIIRTVHSKSERDKWRKFFQGFYKKSLRKKRFMDPKTKRELMNFYVPHNKALEVLLGKKISYWNYD